MKRGAAVGLSVALIVGSGLLVSAQERKHACPTTDVPGRIILTSVQAAKTVPKAIEHPGISFKVTCKQGVHGTMFCELLVDETGAVECVELLKCDHENCPIAAEFRDVLKRWRFTPVQDDQGRPVAFYWTVSMSLHPR